MKIEPQASQGFRALLLEDNEIETEIAIRVLETCGAVEVTAVPGGREALQALLTGGRSYDVILSDLQMPGMDGLEFLREIAQLSPASSIVLVSGVDPAIIRTAELIGRSYGLNMLGGLSKPLSLRNVYPLLLRHFGRAVTTSRGDQPPLALAAIQEGLDQNEFIPYFQPQVSVATRELTGVEALMRWDHRTLGVLAPARFLDSLESSGLINVATDHLFKCCLREIKQWQDQGFDIPVSINISAGSLKDLSLPERLSNMATAAGVSQSKITLEITETTAMTERSQSLETLARLRLKGFGLSVDDYGTGFSSMQQLAQVPFTELKIDQIFVTGASAEPVRLSLLEASVFLAKRLQLQCVAEGVETTEDWKAVSEAGCAIAQGYHISKPLPAGSLLRWYHNWTRVRR